LRSLESRALMLTYDQYTTPAYFGVNDTLAAEEETKRRRFSRFFRRNKSTDTK
jgi:hypothetical protein